MSDESNTTIIAKAIKKCDTNGDSMFFGVSVRGWLAVLVITTVCVIQFVFAIRALMEKDYNYTISGEFMMLASMILVYYFKEKQQKKD
jgi:hypothetical protein